MKEDCAARGGEGVDVADGGGDELHALDVLADGVEGELSGAADD